jgi:hypothetical protein
MENLLTAAQPTQLSAPRHPVQGSSHNAMRYSYLYRAREAARRDNSSDGSEGHGENLFQKLRTIAKLAERRRNMIACNDSGEREN